MVLPFARLHPARRKLRPSAERLYGAAVDQARKPVFYAQWGVPDTVDGRFDLIVVHVYLLCRWLHTAGTEGENLAQILFDVMFKDMDRSLREMGVGDLSVGKKVKQMARGFLGRSEAYDEALDKGQSELVKALGRNVYGTVDVSGDMAAKLASYMIAQDSELARSGATADQISAFSFSAVGVDR